MTRQTNLADQGLDSLLCIELASDIQKVFGVTVDMGSLDSHSVFGDLLDMVVSHNHSAATAAPKVSKSPQLSDKTAAIPHLAASPVSRPASLQRAQRAFEDMRFGYDIFTKQTGFADFWRKVYPAQSRLVLAYTVEAFARLRCRLSSIRSGQRLPRVQSLPKYDLLMRQLEKVLSDASLVRSDGAGLARTDVAVDQTPSRPLFSNILHAFPHHANEHRLLHVTGSKLAECLAGTVDPLALLFRSKENKELLEDVYTHGPMYEAITKLLANFLQHAYQTNREGGVFHILELGGGTGGTTEYIIDFLEKQGVHFTYTFTDLAGSLVTAVKKKFARKDFMDSGLSILRSNRLRNSTTSTTRSSRPTVFMRPGTCSSLGLTYATCSGPTVLSPLSSLRGTCPGSILSLAFSTDGGFSKMGVTMFSPAKLSGIAAYVTLDSSM